MKRLRYQLIRQQMFHWILAAGIVFLLFYFCSEPVTVMLGSRSIRSVWEELKDFDLDAIEQDEMDEDETELLGELGDQAHFVICRPDGEVLFTSEGTHFGKTLKRMMEKQEVFTETPVVKREKGNRRYRLLLQGRIPFEDTSYLVLIYHNLHIRMKRVQAVEWSILCSLLLSAVLFLLFFALSWKKAEKSFLPVLRQIEGLAMGRYNIRLPVSVNGNEAAEAMRDLHMVADRMQIDDNTLHNYRYLLKKTEARSKQDDDRQRAVVSNLTHQLKTPLAIISSQVELAQTEADPGKRNYYYNSVMEEIDKMSSLISTVLISETGFLTGPDAVLRRICLSESLSEIVPKYATWLSSKGIVFQASIEPAVYVQGDPALLEQAVNNYMMNACTRTRPDRQVILSLQKENQDCVIRVYNDGEGIPESEKEHIWERHYSTGTQGRDMEAGLGLYIVRQIVSSHHGECGVTDLPTGVSFWIRLPVYHSAGVSSVPPGGAEQIIT